MIYFLYWWYIYLNSYYSTDHIRRQWQIDIECEINEDKWASVLKNTHTTMSCNTDRKTQFKITHRLYCSTLLRSRLGQGSPECIKSKSDIGTYIHMFWTKIQTFWVNVMDEIVALLGYNLELSPLECILAAKVKTMQGTIPNWLENCYT